MTQILISGGAVLTMDPSVPDLQQGDVLIDADRIVAVGRNLSAEGATRIDASGLVVMPGLVNAHLHCWQTPLRGVAADWTLKDYLQKVLGEFGPRFSPEDIYWATLAAALDQIDAGVTTLVDWCHNAPTPAHAQAALEALRDAGIRALFLRGAFTFQPGGFTTLNDGSSTEGGQWKEIGVPSGADGLLTIGMSILGPAYAPLELVRFELNRANVLDQIVSMHFSSSSDTDVFRTLAAEGLVTPKVNIVHGNGLAAEEVRALIDCGATFTVTPEIEMQMGFSPCTTGLIRAHGAKPSLGVDTESSSSSDLFQVMRFTLQLQRYMDHQLARANTTEPLETVSIGAREALQWATIEGARAAGLEASVGTLTPGKRADIILVRVPEVQSGLDPIQLIVSRAAAADVDTVFVGGRLKKRSGQRLGAARDEVGKNLAQISRRILSPLSSSL
ncbi:amidohydrolase family protein [Xanthobacter autotrophicus]|uniref:amidohydrolase family protein n=1 Tax=Xanthobacter autotrophicus TaxID=280 RepID=UPI0024A761B3|nr:amidohydrolase family protein [Xanthobacter autotrophicus]MDI4654985.1 amidohydrolase family protein [Xanthobacter autotrophicus]